MSVWFAPAQDHFKWLPICIWLSVRLLHSDQNPLSRPGMFPKSLLDGISRTTNALIHISARACSSEIITMDDNVGFCLSLLKLPAAQSMSFYVSCFSLKSEFDFNNV